MNDLPSNDPLLLSLRRLPPAEPDSWHDDRVRQQCHAALAARRRGPSSRWPRLVPRRFETVLVGAFGLVYLAAILYDASHVYR